MTVRRADAEPDRRDALSARTAARRLFRLKRPATTAAALLCAIFDFPVDLQIARERTVRTLEWHHRPSARRPPARQREVGQAHPQRRPYRTAARRSRSRNLPQPFAGRVSGVGRPGLRRPELVLLRPRGSFPRARAPSVPRRVPRDADGADRLHHLGVIFADDRSVPDRRRRLPGRDQAARQIFRPGLRIGAGRRLRADHFDFDRERRRRDLQLPARRMAALQILVVPSGRGVDGADEPARGEGIGAVAAADLHRLHRDACVAGRLRDSQPRAGAAVNRRPRRARGPRQLAQHRDARARGDFLPRLQPWRRHLHRNRGGQQRPADSARAAHRDRQAHDDLHGDVAGLRRRRNSARLPAAQRRGRDRQDPQRRHVRAARFQLAAIRLSASAPGSSPSRC